MLPNGVLSPNGQRPAWLCASLFRNKVHNQQHAADPQPRRQPPNRLPGVVEMVQPPPDSRDVEAEQFGPVQLGGVGQEVALDRARRPHRRDLRRGRELVEALDHVGREVEGLDGGHGGAEGAGDHARAAGVVEEGGGALVLGDADEVEVLLDEGCELEQDFLLPWFDVISSGQVVEKGAVCGGEVCGGSGCCCHGFLLYGLWGKKKFFLALLKRLARKWGVLCLVGISFVVYFDKAEKAVERA